MTSLHFSSVVLDRHTIELQTRGVSREHSILGFDRTGSENRIFSLNFLTFYLKSSAFEQKVIIWLCTKWFL
jgi:hypothetical protein